MLLHVIVMGVFGQDASVPSTGFLLDLITNIGLGGVFIWLYLDERKERRAAQALNSQLLERILPALSDSTATLGEVQESMKHVTEAQGHARRSEVSELSESIEKLRRDLGGG